MEWFLDIWRVQQDTFEFPTLRNYPYEKWVPLGSFPTKITLESLIPVLFQNEYLDLDAPLGQNSFFEQGGRTFEECVQIGKTIVGWYGDSVVRVRIRLLETGESIPLELL